MGYLMGFGFVGDFEGDPTLAINPGVYNADGSDQDANSRNAFHDINTWAALRTSFGTMDGGAGFHQFIYVNRGFPEPYETLPRPFFGPAGGNTFQWGGVSQYTFGFSPIPGTENWKFVISMTGNYLDAGDPYPYTPPTLDINGPFINNRESLIGKNVTVYTNGSSYTFSLTAAGISQAGQVGFTINEAPSFERIDLSDLST
jgi:hypothetical protein